MYNVCEFSVFYTGAIELALCFLREQLLYVFRLYT